MRTRVWIGIVALMAIAVAVQRADLAAGYVAVGIWAIVFLLHAIEFKINRLLSDRGIHVHDAEIKKE